MRQWINSIGNIERKIYLALYAEQSDNTNYLVKT